MKKCKGCGIELQFENANLKGYAINETQDYCKRCFRLTHYGDIKNVYSEKIDNKKVEDIYDKYKNDLFVLIVDCFDAFIISKDIFVDYFRSKKVLLIINKLDLLPINVNDNKINNIYINEINKIKNVNIIDCILTWNKDDSFNELFYSILDQHKISKAIFAGKTNAGKSTIINKLLLNNDLTTSIYPGTTINENIINIDNYTFIDTPGLNDNNSFIYNIETQKLNLLNPKKTIKPKTYQLYEDQSYCVEGIIRVDILPKTRCNITFYINNELEVHRTSLKNADNYIENNKNRFKLKLLPFESNEYSVNKELFLYIKGLGFIKIIGKGKINIKLNKLIKPYISEVSI